MAAAAVGAVVGVVMRVVRTVTVALGAVVALVVFEAVQAGFEVMQELVVRGSARRRVRSPSSGAEAAGVRNYECRLLLLAVCHSLQVQVLVVARKLFPVSLQVQ